VARKARCWSWIIFHTKKRRSKLVVSVIACFDLCLDSTVFCFGLLVFHRITITSLLQSFPSERSYTVTHQTVQLWTHVGRLWAAPGSPYGFYHQGPPWICSSCHQGSYMGCTIKLHTSYLGCYSQQPMFVPWRTHMGSVNQEWTHACCLWAVPGSLYGFYEGMPRFVRCGFR